MDTQLEFIEKNSPARDAAGNFVLTPAERTAALAHIQAQCPIGARVRKKSGSSWQGTVCGYYATSLTPDGVAVESEREPGSVQVYPLRALEFIHAE